MAPAFRFLAVASMLSLGGTPAAGQDLAPLSMRLNGEDRGTLLVRIDAERPCLTSDQLRSLGAPDTAPDPRHRGDTVRVVPLAQDAACFGADDLAPHIRLAFDASAGILDVHVEPELLGRQSVQAARTAEPLPASYPRSAYLNYGIDLSRDTASGAIDALAPLEVAARWDRWLADTTLIVDRDGGAQRLLSSAQRDFPERLAALRFGDIAPITGSAAGTALLGVQFAREYAYEPLVRRSPGLDFAGVLDTPSTVEVYVDGRLVSRVQLPAGPFDIRDLPASAGSGGVVRVEIVDAFGNRRALEQPYFIGGGLLAEGNSEFSYELGLPRQYGARGDRYRRDPALLFAHRRGLHRLLTLGYEGFATQNLQGLGGRADVGVGRAGEISMAGLATRTNDGASGYQAVAAYRYNDPTRSFAADFVERSAAFDRLGAPRRGLERRWRANLRHRITDRWSASLGYTRTRLPSAARGDSTVSTSGVLAGLIGYLAGANLSLQAQWDPSTSEAGLLVLFSSSTRSGALTQMSFSDTGDMRDVGGAYIAPVRGYAEDGYRVDARHREDDRGETAASFSGEYEHRATRFTARAVHRHEDDTGRTGATFAGSVALSGDGLAMGQPIRGSFVAVEVPQVAGAEVYADGRLIGRSGSGPVMVSDLTPYMPHALSLRLPEELPIGIDIPTDARRISVADRGGHWMRFAARILRLYEGRVVRVGDGAPVEFTPVTVAMRDGRVVQETVTGEGGYLYLEHLEPGPYTVHLGGIRPCAFDLRLPEGNDTINVIGEQACAPRSVEEITAAAGPGA
jgi:outer membrane usher protein